MENTEILSIERKTVKHTVKFIINRIKNLKALLSMQKADAKEFGGYEDCGEFYHNEVMQTEAAIEELVRLKISMEKYAKKLKYEINSKYGNNVLKNGCQPGCMAFNNKDIRHHKDCQFYPESLSKMVDDLIAENKELKSIKK